VRARLVFAWYDVWVGAYWDRLDRHLYIFPLPMLGVRLDFGRPFGWDRKVDR